MAYEYIRIIGDCFPETQAVVPNGKNRYDYNDLVWITNPISQAELEASSCAIDAQSHEETTVNVLGNIQPGQILVWDGTSWIPQTPGIKNSLYSISFSYESSRVKNRWLSYSGGNGFSSDEVPAVLPWNCELVGMTFTNQDDSIDADLELYVADAENGGNDTLRLTWSIRNARVGYKTDITGQTFNAGDKIGVYVRDKGTDADYPVVTLLMNITSSVSSDTVEDFTSDF